MMQLQEFVRALGYGAGVLLCLALAIEYGNRNERRLAAAFATQSLLMSILLLVVVVRFYGYADAVFSRILATPVVIFHVAALALLLWRLTREARRV